MKTEQVEKKYKYEKIVDHLAFAIECGVIKSGGKLPSLRNTAQQFDCAVSVVLQAYQELEINNLIRGVEKSGYFALPKQQTALPSPEKYEHQLNSINSTPHSLTSKIVEMGTDRSIIPFGCAIPCDSILPIPRLKKHLTYLVKNKPELLSSYTPGGGNLKLRHEIAKLMIQKNVSLTADDILITNGCSEALAIAVKAVSNPDDTIAVECPGYFGLSSLLQQLDRNILEIPCSSYAGLELDALKTKLQTTKISACIVSANIQNPLGFVMPSEQRQELLKLAERFDFTIIEDDIYGECRFDNKTQHPLKAIDSNNRVIYCSSFSKTVSPSMRIGWLIGGQLQKRCEQIKFSESLGGPVLLQQAMADFLQDGGYNFHMKKFRKKIAQQTFQIKSLLLENLPTNVKVSQPVGGFFLWLELDDTKDSMFIFNRALQEKIGIVPGPIFSTNPKMFKNCIRISCGSPITEKLENGIVTLAEIINTHNSNG